MKFFVTIKKVIANCNGIGYILIPFLFFNTLDSLKMAKRNILLTYTLISFIYVSAQTVDFSSFQNSTKADSIAKIVLDDTQYLVIYDYEYVRDTAFPEDKRSGVTMLQMGKRYNRFMDYNEFRFDSLMDATAKNLKSYSETGPMMVMALKKRKFRENIVIDKQKNMETIQRTAGLIQRYQYDEPCPTLNWELAEGDTIIADYHCKKALVSLWGRDYIAWYSPDVDLPYGPYKFNNLPGLIFQVVDTRENHKFTLNGLIKVTQYHPIYLWADKDIIKTNRNKVRKIYKNYCADPISALTSSSDIQISDGVKASVTPKPYNPIELE